MSDQLNTGTPLFWGPVLFLVLLTACSGDRGALARDMILPVERGPGGLVGDAEVEGPAIWTGGTLRSRPLATDHTGTRVAVTDGAQVAIWDASRRRLERVLPEAGQVGQTILGAAFSPQGRTILIEEEELERQSGLLRLRVVDLPTGQTLALLRMPCGCLVDYTFTDDGRAIRAMVSGDSVEGTWVMSWNTEGRYLGEVRLSGDSLSADVLAEFSAGGERAVVLEVADSARIQRVDLNGELPTERWPVSGATVSECDPSGGSCLRTLRDAPTIGSVLITATSADGGPMTAESFEYDHRRPRTVSRFENRAPLAWAVLRDGRRGLIAGVGEGKKPPVMLSLGDDGGLLGGREGLSAPVMMRFPRGWAANRLIEPFRAVLGLEVMGPLGLWEYGQSRIDVDPRAGAAIFIKSTVEWLWPREEAPVRLGALDLKKARGCYPRVGRSASGRRTVLAVTSEHVAVVAPLEPGLPRRDWGKESESVVELGRWMPEEGHKIMMAVPFGDEGVIAVLRENHKQARLVRLAPELDRLLAPAARRSVAVVPNASPSWWLGVSPDGRHGALVVRREHREETLVRIEGFDPVTLAPTRSAETRFEYTEPREKVRFAGTPGAQTLAVYSDYRVNLLRLWGDGPLTLSWTPGPGIRIKRAVPMGGNTLAVSLTSRNLSSIEWWAVVELGPEDEQVKILGHRRLVNVVSAAAWAPGGGAGALYLMEERGVATGMVLEGDRVRVDRRAWLHPEEAAFVAIDDAGRVSLPMAGAGRGVAQRWLLDRRMMPVLLDASGAVLAPP